jgi:glycosyltransferase involved in cell wall biosynthesis
VLIGIDGRPFYGARAGTGRYITELCRVLDVALPDANFFVYGNRTMDLPVSGVRWRQRGGDSFLTSHNSPAQWYFLHAGKLASKDGVDIFWGAANFLPLRLDPKIPAILTVYDLVYRLFPQTLNWTHRLAYRLFFEKSLRRARTVVAISQGTSDRLAELHGRGADLVIRPRAGALFSPPHRETIRAALLRYGVDFPYFLSVSTLEPRKNLGALIEAVLQLHAAGELSDMGLVLVGQQGWKNGRLLDALARARSVGVRIVQTGFVPDEWLPPLYAGATAVVMPSLYEGFGMPVLEAKCCNARIVTSDIPEIREAGGVGPIYVQPSVDGIKQGLRAAAMLPRGDDVPDPCIGQGAAWEQEGERLAHAIRSLV